MRRLFSFTACLLLVAAAQSQGIHFSHQTIFVTDLDRAANFYEKVLELSGSPNPFTTANMSGSGSLSMVSCM